jgi:DNA-binding NarL/FixJ family response regulator
MARQTAKTMKGNPIPGISRVAWTLPWVAHRPDRVCQAAIDPAVQQHLVDAITASRPSPGAEPAPQLPDGLTTREGEVLSLIAHGMSNTEIANQLMVSETTVKSHINHLFAKTGVRDRAQAVTYAYQHGLT